MKVAKKLVQIEQVLHLIGAAIAQPQAKNIKMVQTKLTRLKIEQEAHLAQMPEQLALQVAQT